jgi:hypothetical protein
VRDAGEQLDRPGPASSPEALTQRSACSFSHRG